MLQPVRKRCIEVCCLLFLLLKADHVPNAMHFNPVIPVKLLKWSALCPDLWAKIPGRDWQFGNHSMDATSMWSHVGSLTCLERLKPEIHEDSGKEWTWHGYPIWHNYSNYSISADYLWQTHIQKIVSEQKQFVELRHGWRVAIPQLSSKGLIATSDRRYKRRHGLWDQP